MRSGLGHNNNPSAREFISLYKKLMVRHQIKGIGGNAIPLDDTVILHVTSRRRPVAHIDAQDINILKCLGQDIATSLKDDEDTNDEEVLPEESLLTLPQELQYKSAVITYIAGFVVKMVMRTVKCPVCVTALLAEREDLASSTYSLISHKTRGGLIYPSPSVVRLCRMAEKQFNVVEENRDTLTQANFLQRHITMPILMDICQSRSS